MYELTRESKYVWLYGGFLFRLISGHCEILGAEETLYSGQPLLWTSAYTGDPDIHVKELIADRYQSLVDQAIARRISPLRCGAWATGCAIPWEIVRIQDPEARATALAAYRDHVDSTQ